MKRGPVVLRWDLDKTYLVSEFESLRYLLRVPFQRAKDKISLPGVAALIKEIRRTVEGRGRSLSVYFLSASPPQIGAAIREKLTLDGIGYDGITFKDQVRHLIHARFDAVLEQIGYKLEQLLKNACEAAPGSVELLFGDDWESDPFVYSAYADIVAGRLGREAVADILLRAQVSRHYADTILELVDAARSPTEVEGIFILRQRPARAGDLDAFGPRLVWFDNYFECALRLWDAGFLDTHGVVEVLVDIGLDPALAAASYEAVCERSPHVRARLAPLGRALRRRGVMDSVARASWRERLAVFLERLRVRGSTRYSREATPLDQLVERWSYRGGKEAVHGEEYVDHRTDDRSR